MAQDEALDLLEKKIKKSEEKLLEGYRKALKNDDPIELLGTFITDLLSETILTTQEIARLIKKNQSNTSKNINKLLKEEEVKVVRSEEDERSKRYTIR